MVAARGGGRHPSRPAKELLPSLPLAPAPRRRSRTGGLGAEAGDEAPAPRPESWGDELPEDPILESQASPCAVVKVAARGHKRLSPTKGTLQKQVQCCPLDRWLKRSPKVLQPGPTEGAADKAAVCVEGDVSLKRPLSDETPVGEALREGIRARLAGYGLALARRTHVSEATVQLPVDPAPEKPGATGTSEATVQLPVDPAPEKPGATGTPSTTHLAALCYRSAGERVDVSARVRAAGELERRPLPMQPGETVAMRTLELQQDDVSCQWVLWAKDAENYGPDLLDRKVIVHGARVYRANGEDQLTGLATVELCG